jgi:hypothetical protein
MKNKLPQSDIEKLLKSCIMIELNMMTSCLTSRIQSSDANSERGGLTRSMSLKKNKKQAKLSVINEDESIFLTSA